MKAPIRLLNVFLWILVPAAVLGFLAAAGPALFGAAVATKTAGLIGAGVGAALGVVVGAIRRFR